MFFDPVYILFILPALLLAAWAQLRVKSTFAEASQIAPESGMTGAEAAAHILGIKGLGRVGIEVTQGFLGDHYDPREKVLRLSPDVYHGRSLAAVGVAAHEAGHAVQDAEGYTPLVVRNAVVPLASFGSSMTWVLMAFGLVINSFNLIMLGILAYTGVVAFQVVNLPVEFNASARAKEALVSAGVIAPDEGGMVSKVLNAAALTYVAATLTAVLTLLYHLFRFGLVGGERE